MNINRTYGNLASLKTWTLSAYTKDAKDSTIHTGGVAFDVIPADTVDVTLDLDAMYSMLKAHFMPVRDSVTSVTLKVDDLSVDDSSFVSGAHDTVSLAFDYLKTDASTTHKIELTANGVYWGFDYPLYAGDTTIVVNPGQDTTDTVVLEWIGPDKPPVGGATMTVTLGAIGTVTVNGYLDFDPHTGFVLDTGSFVDARDAQVYRTTKIGTQTWMAENLSFDAGTGSYCYGDVPANCKNYGRLYTWGVAMGGGESSNANPSGVQGICPEEWHMPSNGEWDR